MTNVIQLYNISNGLVDVVIANYGCTIVSVHAPDRYEQKGNIVAGYDDPKNYLGDHPYLGSTVGRYAGRIANGKFSLDGKKYSLSLNSGLNHLHGGIEAFYRKYWEKEGSGNNWLTLSCISENDEEGYPGKLQVSINFTLSPDNALSINYRAVTDAPTIINLTNHVYFNLSGFKEPTIYYHELQVFADRFTVKNQNQIPTGELKPVALTPFDFRKPKKIGADIGLLTDDSGYDINLVLNNESGYPAIAAIMKEPGSGRVLKVFTDRPGLQVFTSNWDDSSPEAMVKMPFPKHGAIALETQAFPDSPNHPEFPNTVLRPGEEFNSTTIYQFSTDQNMGAV